MPVAVNPQTALAFEECIEYSLANDIVRNAVIVGERYYAYRPCEESALLLGEAFLRANEPQRCYVLFNNFFGSPSRSSSQNPGTRDSDASHQQSRSRSSLAEQSEEVLYMYARVCAALNKYDEAEEALLAVPERIPRGAAGFFFLGTICQRMQQHNRAIGYFTKALELNPFLFTAYEALCSLGAHSVASPSLLFAAERVLPTELSTVAQFNESEVFHTTEAEISQHSDVELHHHNEHDHEHEHEHDNRPLHATSSTIIQGTLPLTDTPFQQTTSFQQATPVQERLFTADTPKAFQPRRAAGSGGAARKMQFMTPMTPGALLSPVVAAPPLVTPVISITDFSAKRSLTTPFAGAMTPFADHQESSFLQLQSGLADPFLSKVDDDEDDDVDTENHGDEGNTTFSGYDSMDQSSQLADVQSITSVGLHYILDVFRMMARGLRALARYQCDRALELFHRLPTEQVNSPWVRAQIARCYFEMGQYRQAQKAYARLRRADPAYIAGMDYYSVALWQLQDDVALSGLAQELVACNRLAPQTWCAVGNCFSLQKEHLTALKFFHRAVQLNPSFAYTYSLCGHEYIATDDLDKAMTAFRKGIRYAPTQYNSWYGLGLVFMRQKKYELAFYHFSRAQQINPTSSIIRLHLGMVLREQGRFEEACEQMQQARRFDPKNILASFHHASVLRELKQYDRTLVELRKLQQVLPAEAPIYMLLGKICHRLRQYDRALAYFHTALDLSPRDAPSIKPLIERITNKALALAEKAAQAQDSVSSIAGSTPRHGQSFDTTAGSTIDRADELA